MAALKLRDEFLAKHMRATAIELCNRQNTGWTQRGNPDELLEITYPTADVQRAIGAVSAGRPIVLLGQRGSRPMRRALQRDKNLYRAWPKT